MDRWIDDDSSLGNILDDDDAILSEDDIMLLHYDDVVEIHEFKLVSEHARTFLLV
jgi:hypothetical protein